MRSFADRISFTASFWPAVSGPLLRCPCTCQPRMRARPRAWPPCMSATVSRSSPTVRSVVSEASAPGRSTACSVPVFSSAATSRSTSPIPTAPGAWASALARRSVRENTASRSERCAIAHATAPAAGEGGVASATGLRSGACIPAPTAAVSRDGAAMTAVPVRPASPMSGAPGASGSGVLPAPKAGSGTVSRSAGPDRSTAPATSAPGSRPRSAACFAHTPRSSSRSMSRFFARVISAARSAMPGLSAEAPSPRSSIAASISARRLENASIAARGTPEISKRPSAWVFSIP